MAYRIGQYFKENNQEGSVSHLLAHALLGAAVSAATGNDVSIGALSGATSEKSAPALAAYLFGTNDPKELTQEQKDTITSIITLGTAGIAYGATDGDVGSAVSAGEVSKGSVENNSAELIYLAETEAAWIAADGDKDKYYESLQKIAERDMIALDLLTLPLGAGTKVVRVGTGYAIEHGGKIIIKGFKSQAEAERALPYSIAQKAKLREELAKQAGIPRDIIKKPSSVWGKTPEQIKQSFEMNGAIVTKKPPKAKTSGNGQVYEIKDSASGIKEFEYHAGGGVHTPKGVFYYKIVKNDGTEIRIIDPSKPFNPGTIKQNQIYMDKFGNQIIFKNGKWEIKK